MQKLLLVAAFLVLVAAMATQAVPVSSEDVNKYMKELGLGEGNLKQISGLLKDLGANKNVDLKDAALDDDDADDSQVKEKLINFINKVDKIVKKINPKKFYEEKVKKSKYYKFFFGDEYNSSD